jgi:hypothetical protein
LGLGSEFPEKQKNLGFWAWKTRSLLKKNLMRIFPKYFFYQKTLDFFDERKRHYLSKKPLINTFDIELLPSISEYQMERNQRERVPFRTDRNDTPVLLESGVPFLFYFFEF